MVPMPTPKHAHTDESREAIKQFFMQERGYWRPWTETLLQENPDFVQQYARFAGYPARTGPLSLRMVELIYVGLDASSSHMFEVGLRTHMQRALEVGASHADIFDVLHLVVVQGAARVCDATSVLAQVLAERGDDSVLQRKASEKTTDADAQAYGLHVEALEQLDPGYVEVLKAFVQGGHTGHGLADGERTLVLIALHGCFTAYAPAALKQLLHTGLAQGLSASEISQALQMGGHLAVHGTALGAQVFQALVSPSDF